MHVCVIEVFETITRDSGGHLQMGQGEVSAGLSAKLKSALILEKRLIIFIYKLNFSCNMLF